MTALGSPSALSSLALWREPAAPVAAYSSGAPVVMACAGYLRILNRPIRATSAWSIALECVDIEERDDSAKSENNFGNRGRDSTD